MSRTLFSGLLCSRIVCAMRDWTSEMLAAISSGEGEFSSAVLLEEDMLR